MTTDEHLDLILAKCRALLALAEKRTPGEWSKHPNIAINRWQITTGRYNCAEVLTEGNAGFIAACAESAEAGWRATIAAIEGLRNNGGWMNNDRVISIILTAWPESML